MTFLSICGIKITMSESIQKITALDLAKYLVRLNEKNEDFGEVLTNLKIQKLAYYIQGFHLAYFDEPLFDDPIVAWQYGPVVVSLYDSLKKFGNNAVIFTDDSVVKMNKKQRDLIDAIFNQIGQYSAWKLVEMTHSEDPWKSVNLQEEITKESLSAFFKTKLVK